MDPMEAVLRSITLIHAQWACSGTTSAPGWCLCALYEQLCVHSDYFLDIQVGKNQLSSDRFGPLGIC